MRADFEEIKANFLSVEPTLKEIAIKIEHHLTDILKDLQHIDRVGCRVKSEKSFMDKTLKEENGKLKYSVPLKEIQDMVGARIIVYYNTDIDTVVDVLLRFFQKVEKRSIVPDDVRQFGYEGLHYICFIPSPIYSHHRSNPLVPDFFELQIKTLYQHSWSQTEHGLGYKPNTPLTADQQRRIAFIAAQSWGADTILEELTKNQISNN